MCVKYQRISCLFYMLHFVCEQGLRNQCGITGSADQKPAIQHALWGYAAHSGFLRTSPGIHPFSKHAGYSGL